MFFTPSFGFVVTFTFVLWFAVLTSFGVAFGIVAVMLTIYLLGLFLSDVLRRFVIVVILL